MADEVKWPVGNGIHLVRAIIADVFLGDHGMWACPRCGHQTTILSEVCEGCGVEDLTRRVPDEAP